MSDEDIDPAADGPVRVTIFGQTYTLRASGGAERAAAVARLVDERMRLIASRLAVHDYAKVAVLAALNFADELEALKGESDAKPPQATPAGDEPPARSSASWFDAFFDSDSPNGGDAERLSARVASRLQERQRPSRDAGPAPAPRDE